MQGCRWSSRTQSAVAVAVQQDPRLTIFTVGPRGSRKDANQLAFILSKLCAGTGDEFVRPGAAIARRLGQAYGQVLAARRE